MNRLKEKIDATKDMSRPQSGDFFRSKNAGLVLENGVKFSGLVPLWQNDSRPGEVVFNTGMTGYVQSLTDPSYAEQILVFTYPLIGNYGVYDSGWESKRIYAAGVVVSEHTLGWSHPGSTKSFLSWLKEQKVPLIYGVDTRALTQQLRTRGVVNGVISSDSSKVTDFKPKKPLVSIDKPVLIKTPGALKTVVLLDCGAKENIPRSLTSRKLNVLRVPYDYDFTAEKYNGVVLSNGPGNPMDYQSSIKIVEKLIEGDKPVFGICLGSQLMALAAGAKTYKLKFGHRGHNQPCRDNNTGHCYITSQNHGYAVDESSLPKGWQVYFTNLNDDSVEGIIHKSKPFSAVQFHPEASPGPTDTEWLFERFVSQL